MRYVGPSRLSFDPLLDRRMGNYFESNLAVSLQAGTIVLGLEIDNLVGGHVDTFAFGNQLRVLDGAQFTPQKPTSAALTVSASF